jgi:hypothetical protein
LTLVGGDRLVVVAGQLVWVARLDAGKEQTIRLPEPGRVTISYDIEGAPKDGVFRLRLMSWRMPDWRGVVETTRFVTCRNGQSIDVVDLEPGEYDVFRSVGILCLDGMGEGSMLDRGKLKVESGKATKLECVRAKGCPISGQVIGLKEAHLPGAFIYVQREQAWGDTQVEEDLWRLTVFDAVVTGPDGQFKTSRISPGTYMVAAYVYKPVEGLAPGCMTLPQPHVLGKVKVVVPESGEVKPIRIEIAPLSDKKAAAPASQPAPTATSADKPATQPASAPAAARTIADVKTLEDLQNVETIHVNKRWAVRLGLSDGGKDAGPWKLLYCLADFPPQKNTDPLLPPPKPRRFRYPGRKPIDNRKAQIGRAHV